MVVICLKIRTFVVSATTHRKISKYMRVLWFAWKFVPLWYQQQPKKNFNQRDGSCDLLENSYLCGISNNSVCQIASSASVVICLKIRTFVVSATTSLFTIPICSMLWFAWKFVPLWYQQQPVWRRLLAVWVVICLKIRTFVVSATTIFRLNHIRLLLWFAWKFVPLWYQQQLLQK